MNIGIDIMGGDFAPFEILKGVILASELIENDDKLFLFGKEDIIRKALDEYGTSTEKFVVVDCEQVIEMDDEPVKAFKEKSESSIVKGFIYLKSKKIDGFASAGNTGAMLVGATQVVGVINGILRPGISSYYPNNQGGYNLLIDVGLNPDTKPEVMLQYARMGSIFAQTVLKIENPKVSLLNIGSEDSKGTPSTKAAYQLLADDDKINFIGNIEGGDLHKGDISNVIVADGFTGNIVLKQAESFYKLLKERGISDEYFDRYNYENYGGMPVLGVNSPVIIGHGISSEIAIKNMILQTKNIINSDLSGKIIKAFDV